MKTTNNYALQGRNNFENTVVSSPKKSERSPQLKFVRRPAYNKNFIDSNMQEVFRAQVNCLSPKRSFKGSDIGTFTSNPQDAKHLHKQPTNVQNLGKQDQLINKSNKPSVNVFQKLQRKTQKPQPKRSFNIDRFKQADSRQLQILRQEISTKKRAIQNIRVTSTSKQKNSQEKYNQLQNQYHTALQKIKKLEQSQNYKLKKKKASTTQIRNQLRAKSVKLETDIFELQEKYHKKMEQCKYHQIQIEMLRKRKNEMKNSEFKLQMMTQKNKQLARRVQSMKKQLVHVNSCKDSIEKKVIKRKNSVDSLFDLSSDQSVEQREKLF